MKPSLSIFVYDEVKTGSSTPDIKRAYKDFIPSFHRIADFLLIDLTLTEAYFALPPTAFIRSSYFGELQTA